MHLNRGLVILSTCMIIMKEAFADLPVHCLHKHIRGHWTFHLGPAVHDKHDIKCSKHVTSDYSSASNNYGLGLPNFTPREQIKVQLLSPNIAKTMVKDREVTGVWTMIYDEGFEVTIAGSKFFAFSKFDTKDGDDVSYCAKTHPGWYHPTRNIDVKKWGCYYGIKDTQVAPARFRKFGRKPVNELPSHFFVPEDEMVQHVNTADMTWKARHYPKFHGRPVADVQRQLGSVLRPYKLQPEDRMEQQQWMVESQVDTSDIPEHWDWRNVGGRNFVGPVVNQGACGSCYAVATAEMIASRMSILKQEKYKPISAATALSCSFYTQGCHGGFPFLASKYAQDFGAAYDAAIPYVPRNGKCRLRGKHQLVSRAMEYQYIGGYYGASSEEAMRRDLFDHGPLVVGFEVAYGLHSYSHGVFSTEVRLPTQNHFQRVNHAVLIVGFGKQGDTPYWLVKNSWGRDWGENGFFRIKRGDDNLNIEHMAVGAYPSLGADFPPKKTQQVMTATSKSMGSHFLKMASLEGNYADIHLQQQNSPTDAEMYKEVDMIVTEDDTTSQP